MTETFELQVDFDFEGGLMVALHAFKCALNKAVADDEISAGLADCLLEDAASIAAKALSEAQ